MLFSKCLPFKKWLKPLQNGRFANSPRFKPWAIDHMISANRFNGL